jgi:hypothetical protein
MFTGQTHKRKALEIWRGLIRSEHEFYEKYGYLDIIFDKSADIYTRKEVRGRLGVS